MSSRVTTRPRCGGLAFPSGSRPRAFRLFPPFPLGSLHSVGFLPASANTYPRARSPRPPSRSSRASPRAAPASQNGVFMSHTSASYSSASATVPALAYLSGVSPPPTRRWTSRTPPRFQHARATSANPRLGSANSARPRCCARRRWSPRRSGISPTSALTAWVRSGAAERRPGARSP